MPEASIFSRLPLSSTVVNIKSRTTSQVNIAATFFTVSIILTCFVVDLGRVDSVLISSGPSDTLKAPGHGRL